MAMPKKQAFLVCKAYPDQHKGTIHPAPNFSAENDCKELRNAMKGLGTDEDKLINVLCHRSLAQRLQIKVQYKTMYGKDLIKEIKSEVSGHFEDVLVALLMDPVEYDAKCLHEAMKGAGTDERCLTEIICTRSNQQIHDLKAVYKQIYKSDLEKDVISETSGFYRRLLVACLQGNRGELSIPQIQKLYSGDIESLYDHQLAKTEAQELMDAGVNKWGTDESAFIRIFVTRESCQLQATILEYEKLSGSDIFKTIDSEMSGDLANSMKTLVLSQVNQSVYFARLLYETMKGLGTRDKPLIRVIVTRSEIDLEKIKKEYSKLTGQTLAEAIAGDTSGDYKKALLAIVK